MLVGWLWYLGVFVPMIGLVQYGTQAIADRFTYLPQIGLCVALAWGAADLGGTWRYRRSMAGVAAALVVALLMVGAWRQTCFWRNSETLWNHTLACAQQNGTAHNNLSIILSAQGRFDEAIIHCQEALKSCPDAPAETHFNLALALARRGRFDEAIARLSARPGNQARRRQGSRLPGRLWPGGGDWPSRWPSSSRPCG